MKIFGYSIRVTIKKFGEDDIYGLVMNGKLSKRKRTMLMREVLETQIVSSCAPSRKLYVIKQTRARYGFGLMEAKLFVEKLFPQRFYTEVDN